MRLCAHTLTLKVTIIRRLYRNDVDHRFSFSRSINNEATMVVIYNGNNNLTPTWPRTLALNYYSYYTVTRWHATWSSFQTICQREEIVVWRNTHRLLIIRHVKYSQSSGVIGRLFPLCTFTDDVPCQRDSLLRSMIELRSRCFWRWISIFYSSKFKSKCIS